jgi:hypothetical protein
MSSQQQNNVAAPGIYIPQAQQQQHVFASKRDPAGKLVCAGFTGGALSLLLTPLLAVCGLCCFHSNQSRGSLFIGASFSTLIWAIFSLVCRYIAIGADDSWRLRNEGRVYNSPYYWDGSSSVLCTNTNVHGAFRGGPDNEYCEKRQ